MRVPPLAGLALAGLLASPAPAADTEAFVIDTAGDLARLCAVQREHPNYLQALHMCHGYLVGVHHFHAALAAAMDRGVYCIETVEPRPTRDEVVADFAAWALETPGAAEREAIDAVLDWAAAAYPCQ